MDIIVKMESTIEVWTTLLCWRKTCFQSILFQNLHLRVLEGSAGTQADPKAELSFGDFSWQQVVFPFQLNLTLRFALLRP